MRKHHSVLGGVVLALALTLSGCGGDDPDPKAQETPSESPSTTRSNPSATPKTDEEKVTAVLERYLTFRDDAYRSGQLVNLTRLKMLATGDEFVRLQSAVVDIKRYDIKVTGQYQHALTEPRRRSDSIFRVMDCENRSGIQERKDGKPVPPPVDPEGNPLGNPVPVVYELVKQKDRWLVGSSDIKWDESC